MPFTSNKFTSFSHSPLNATEDMSAKYSHSGIYDRLPKHPSMSGNDFGYTGNSSTPMTLSKTGTAYGTMTAAGLTDKSPIRGNSFYKAT